MKTKFTNRLALLALALGYLIGMAGCGTVAPKPGAATQASFSAVADGTGNYQNSGALGFTTNGSLVIAPDARDRYNALLKKWGRSLTPAVTNLDCGLTAYTNAIVEPLYNGHKWLPPFRRQSDLWLLDKPGQDHWVAMNLWQSQPATTFAPAGVKPP